MESSSYKLPHTNLEHSSNGLLSFGSPHGMAVNVAKNILSDLAQTVYSFAFGEKGKSLSSSHTLRYTTIMRSQPVILRRSDFFKIKATPKPADQQLGLLLGMNEGFRHGEIRLSKQEHFKIDEGVLYVFDTKDKRLYPLPLDYEVATAFHALPSPTTTSNYVLQRENTFQQRVGKPVGEKWFWRKLKKWAADANVLNYLTFTPNHLRAFFAKEWVRQRYLAGEDPNIPLLSKMLRHRDVVYTWIYLTKFVYLEDLQKELNRFQLPLQPLQELEQNKE